MANLQASIEKIGKEITELNNRMAQKDEEIVGMKEENALQKVQIAKLEDNNRAIKRKMERILFYIPNAKKFLIRRPMPAELLNEMFSLLPMENAFEILVKMPNGLLARNMRKMLKGIEMALRNNKWNEADCGSKLEISAEGLVVKHCGPNKWNCVRAQITTIQKFNLNLHKSIAYFEVEIVAKQNSACIDIGFCTRQFPLEGNGLGGQNSIGILNKWGIYIDGKHINFGNEGGNFQAGEVVGIGIVHFPANSKMKCFASCNGHLLEMVDLPIKFANLQLFPAVTLYYPNESIRANFGSDPWQYNPILEHLAN